MWDIETSSNLKRPGNLIHGILIKTAHKTDNSVLGLGFLEVVRVYNVAECAVRECSGSGESVLRKWV